MAECASCGAHVTARFQRVFGGNDGLVYGCPGCATIRQLYNGEGQSP